jgi:hypothetical protein
VRSNVWLWFASWLLCCVAAVAAGHIGLSRVEHALALQCAKASAGTDSDIVNCFHKYGLETPEGIK